MTTTNDLASLVRQFFDPTSSAAHKKEIEPVLTNFKTQPGSWRQSLVLLRETQDAYVHWFALSVIEDTIWNSWAHVSVQDRTELRQYLLDTYQKQQRDRFVTVKMAKVLIDIAKHEWPHGFPELLPTIEHMTKVHESMARGLVLLKTLCEEVISSRADVSAQRKDELKNLLTQQVPGILILIQRILDNVYDARILSPLSTQAPMPSPNTFGSPYLAAPIMGARSRSASGNGKGSFRDKMFGHIINEEKSFVHGGKLDPASMVHASLALEIMLQLFSWISLSDYMSTPLLLTVFKYAGLNNDDTVQLGVLGMSCINEMLSRSCVPRDFEDFLVQIFRQIFQILKDLTDDNPQKTGNTIEQLDSDYREKFTEFINLFLTQHIRRVENNMTFPMHEFLEQFFRFTFMQPSIEAFQDCLKTWSIFLEHLLDRLSGNGEPATASKQHQQQLINAAANALNHAAPAAASTGPVIDHGRYKAGLLAFVRELLKKLMFSSSGQDLKDIDDVNENSESQTEWDVYLQDGIELIRLVTELYPESVLEQLIPLFAASSTGILQAHLILYGGNNSSNEDKTKLFCYMKDLRTTLRSFAAISHVFVGAFEASFSTTVQLVARLTDIAEYFHTHSIFRHGPQFRKLTCQILVSLDAYRQWLAVFATYAASDPSQQASYEQLVQRLIDIAVKFILSTAGSLDDELVGETSAKFLLGIAINLRPRSFPSAPAIGTLTNALLLLPASSTRSLSSITPSPSPKNSPVSKGPSAIVGGGNGLFPVVRRVCVQAIVSSIVLPYPHVRDSEQAWVQRADVLGGFVKPLLRPLKEIALSTSFATTYNYPHVKQQVASALDLASAILDSVAFESKPPKVLVYDSLAEIFPFAVNFLRVYVQETDTMEVIVSFFLKLFESLRSQLSETFLSETLEVFFSVLGGDRLASQLAQNLNSDANGLMQAEVAARFLTLLRLVIEEPGKNFDMFINHILNVCTSPLSVLVRNHDNPAVAIVRPTFQKLVHAVLQSKWKYFNNASQPDVAAARLVQFSSLLESIAGGLQSNDIETFQLNLRALEKLNEITKLYQRDIFRNHLYAFLEILFGVLLNKSHDLLRDEVINCLYNLASTDFDTFYGPFVTKLLTELTFASPEQKHLLRVDLQSEKDRPSFTSNTNRFAADFSFFRRLSSSPASALAAPS